MIVEQATSQILSPRKDEVKRFIFFKKVAIK